MTPDEVQEMQLAISKLESSVAELDRRAARNYNDIKERIVSLKDDIDAIPCAENEAKIDQIRAETIPALSKAVGKLEVYQVVTWALLFLIISGLVGVSWKVLSAGVLP